jgi:wobble nucleotide-excising tRNase
MKTPNEVIGKLTKDQLKQVEEIEKSAEERLVTHDDTQFDVNDTRATISEDVWKEFVKRANAAGWRAEMKGSVVIVRRPEGR